MLATLFWGKTEATLQTPNWRRLIDHIRKSSAQPVL